jgi:hypothetical protein
MRVLLKGINRVVKRLADGRTEVYYYAWKGGPRLRGKPASPEFHASYNEAVSRKSPAPAGVLLGLLRAFQRHRISLASPIARKPITSPRSS